MAISKRILTKIANKTASDVVLRENIKKVLSAIEEGRQGKRVIEKIIKTL